MLGDFPSPGSAEMRVATNTKGAGVGSINVGDCVEGE
jgi:hypothetical protein